MFKLCSPLRFLFAHLSYHSHGSCSPLTKDFELEFNVESLPERLVYAFLVYTGVLIVPPSEAMPKSICQLVDLYAFINALEYYTLCPGVSMDSYHDLDLCSSVSENGAPIYNSSDGQPSAYVEST